MNFWNEKNLKEALQTANTYNFPENWSSNGLVIWQDNYLPKNMVLARNEGETRGLSVEKNLKLLEDCSAILTTNSAPYFKYNKPIVELKGKNGDAIINMSRYIRKFFTGKVVGVTGSSGKSTTTQMLVDIFSTKCKVNSNIKSKANTSWGIAWNMTRFGIDDDYWVVETSLGGGMSRNAALVKPDYAILTNVAPVHLTGGMQLKDIAEEKSKIFSKTNEDGAAIIYEGMEFFDTAKNAAEYRGLKIITFGESEAADIRIMLDGISVKFNIYGKEYSLCNNEPVGRHILLDMAAALAVVNEEKFDIALALDVLKNFKTLEGRGEEFLSVIPENKTIHVTDEAYNANPLSMAAAITAFGEKYNEKNTVLVLGDMAECGEETERYHREMSKSIDKVSPAKVLLCGKDIKYLYDEIKDIYDTKYYTDINSLQKDFFENLSDEDYVFLKSSHSGELYKLVAKLKSYEIKPQD